MPLTYQTYIQLDKILDAQHPLTPGEHDEMLFIVIHQTYELWFKQILTEVNLLKKRLFANELESSQATFKRILAIFRTLVQQTDILETMTPLSFSSFRSRLDSASGMQSVQFRLIEFAFGLKDASRLSIHPEDSPEHHAIALALTEPSIYDAFLSFANQRGGPGTIPLRVLNRDKTKKHDADPETIEGLEKLYRMRSPAIWICESMIDLDEALQEWRYRHVRMVERTIGNKMGTGGTSGVGYLRASLFTQAFPELWQVRSQF